MIRPPISTALVLWHRQQELAQANFRAQLQFGGEFNDFLAIPAFLCRRLHHPGPGVNILGLRKGSRIRQFPTLLRNQEPGRFEFGQGGMHTQATR